MIQFNDKGYIMPADVIETDLPTFEQIFLFNDHRRNIFQEYTVFLNSLKDLGIYSFYQWLNGSFTTLKPNPNDLDVVTFIDFMQYQKHETALYNLKQAFKNRRIDSYFVAVYPEKHDDYSLFQNYDYDFWHKFTRDFKREIRLKTPLKKGFIKIHFDNETGRTNVES
jgi:hypothetical protein